MTQMTEFRVFQYYQVPTTDLEPSTEFTWSAKCTPDSRPVGIGKWRQKACILQLFSYAMYTYT